MKSLFYTLLFSVLTTISAQANEISCQSNTQLTIRLVGLEASPATLQQIFFSDVSGPKDTLIAAVTGNSDSIYVGFVHLETVSVFEFDLDKASLELASFSLTVKELGSPGSPSQSHLFSCVKL